MIIDIKNERLGNFIKHIMYQPFPFENQRYFGKKDELFFEDLFTIEMAKYFYIGEESYRSDPTPRRLACTPSFNQEMIISECQSLEKRLIEFKHFMDIRSSLRVLHCGRGLDLVLLLNLSNWNKVTVEDEDIRYYDHLSFFPELKVNLESEGEEYVHSCQRLCKQ